MLDFGKMFIPSVYFWGTLLGGAGVGIGMAVIIAAVGWLTRAVKP